MQNAKEWLAVKGASWRHPHGPDSDVKGKRNHPVVQISYNDAFEYCTWAQRELPSEVEWEYAARGGLVNMSFPWGDTFSYLNLNIWEEDKKKMEEEKKKNGEDRFPSNNNKMSDGYLGTAPVLSFQSNGFGLYNMVGNVWEWCAGGTKQNRVLRGGSFVDSYDGNYHHAVRVSTRMVNSADSAADNNGFRCISRPNRGKRASSEAEDNALGESSSNDDGINGSGKGDKKIERMEL